MKKELVVSLILVGLVLFALGLQPYLFNAEESKQSTREEIVTGASDYPSLAVELSEMINNISPTPALGELGWMAQRISFIKDGSRAYIEYTDARIALRLLLEYYNQDGELKATVLATFIPTEFGGWELQYGKDRDQGKNLSHFVFDGDSNQWIPEIK
ncbi:MAG: hypothetical protein COT91_04975 [Candidatus Doudnabacteria bacterium CG10_big_fil_rev_8_21_14_0_10_41_10]|uniref:Uncharacterized protein n=1 Tax=Candidatus Doudnabacteria bacterium CG10_big_fil_rev_8_21_14_0_10_41_10 TaxID=1974551 RepID=A0A2H0VEP9_9BACT|nr:MAG: hypothetical protein COT91_04975 [Candidatus Doudnabacteria bacterium CG10_big_fil_rev_8_21_14_0_10_41_10]